MKDQPTFFDFAAEVGLTKHIGGVTATEMLIELCHIGRESTILDVGCGVGATACASLPQRLAAGWLAWTSWKRWSSGPGRGHPEKS